jgi:hypothetical protein
MVFDGMRVVSTKTNGWQQLCWEMAQAGTAFEVPDVAPKQILFLQELCAAYRYRHKIFGNKVQLIPTSLVADGVNGEIEAELKTLLQKITGSGEKPDKELLGRCNRYIAWCLETENLSEKAIEIAQRILDVMEARLNGEF